MLLLGLCASTTNHRCVPLYSYGMYPNATVYKCSMWCAVGCVVTPLCIMYNTQHLYCRHWCVHIGCVCVCVRMYLCDIKRENVSIVQYIEAMTPPTVYCFITRLKQTVFANDFGPGRERSSI